MKTSKPRGANPGPVNLKAEMDAAFATVQSAMAQRAVGSREAGTVVAECVRKTATLVNAALAEGGRTEAEKRLLEAKLRALVEAAARIPAF